ncbi:MAG: VOC family protein [Thaumarchaeota archaeon]|nr:VOC family protein [Nitrososphaerota archaeon]
MPPIGRIETVLLNVKDVQKSAKFYGELLGIEFEPITEHTISEGISFKSAWCPSYGLELIEQTSPRVKEGVRGFSIRVPDVEKINAEMESRGFMPAHEARMPRANEHEVVYNLDGFRFIITQHDDY